MQPDAEFKEFEPRLKFETRLKYGWFHLSLYSMFQDLSRHGSNSLKSKLMTFLNLKFLYYNISLQPLKFKPTISTLSGNQSVKYRRFTLSC